MSLKASATLNRKSIVNEIAKKFESIANNITVESLSPSAAVAPSTGTTAHEKQTEEEEEEDSIDPQLSAESLPSALPPSSSSDLKAPVLLSSLKKRVDQPQKKLPSGGSLKTKRSIEPATNTNGAGFDVNAVVMDCQNNEPERRSSSSNINSTTQWETCFVHTSTLTTTSNENQQAATSAADTNGAAQLDITASVNAFENGTVRSLPAALPHAVKKVKSNVNSDEAPQSPATSSAAALQDKVASLDEQLQELRAEMQDVHKTFNLMYTELKLIDRVRDQEMKRLRKKILFLTRKSFDLSFNTDDEEEIEDKTVTF